MRRYAPSRRCLSRSIGAGGSNPIRASASRPSTGIIWPGRCFWGCCTRWSRRGARKDLDFIWLLEGFTPDHTTLAKFRTQNAEPIKGLQAHFARSLVEQRENALLCLIVDGTRLRADSGRQGTQTAQSIEYIIGELERRMQALNRGDACDEAAAQRAWLKGLEEPAPYKPVPANPEIARLEKKLAKYEKALKIARQRAAQSRLHNGDKARPTRVPVTVPEEQWVRLPRTGGRLARSAFVYNAEEDAYYCPMGQRLDPYKRGKSKDGVQCTYYHTRACAGCPLAAQCTKGKGVRSITRDQYEDLREAADQRMATPEGKGIYKQRAPGIEGVFGTIKANLGIRRFRVRGLAKVRAEWSWIYTAYNIKKLLTLEATAATGGPANGMSKAAPD